MQMAGSALYARAPSPRVTERSGPSSEGVEPEGPQMMASGGAPQGLQVEPAQRGPGLEFMSARTPAMIVSTALGWARRLTLGLSRCPRGTPTPTTPQASPSVGKDGLLLFS